MIMTEKEMDEQIELMEMMRDATEEEVESVHNYIDSISEPLYTFTEEELEKHDKQIRAEVLDEFLKKDKECQQESKECPYMYSDIGCVECIARQLKEQSK